MLRFLAFGALSMALVSAFALYSINTKTRRLAETVDARERHKAELVSSIAVLKAERAFRGRTEVIEPLARQLGMRPISGQQIGERGRLPRRVDR